jgi:hypothetical protein
LRKTVIPADPQRGAVRSCLQSDNREYRGFTLPISKSRRHKPTKVDRQRNLARGVVSAAKEHSYDFDFDKRAVRYQEGLRQMMLEATKNLPVHEYEKFLKWFERQGTASLDVGQVMPASYTLLSSSYDQNASELESQLLWALTRISHEQSTISAFRRLADIVERRLLSGDSDGVENGLNDIEAAFGPSIWLIEARIAYSQWFHGLEAQKKATERIRGKRRRGLASFIAHMVSIRNEPSMAMSRFRTSTKERIEKFKTESLRTYLRFRVLSELPQNEFEAASILTVEKGHSIHDIYETVIRLLQHWVIGTRRPHYEKFIRLALTHLNGIDDFRMSRIEAALRDPNSPAEWLGGPNLNMSLATSYRSAIRRLKDHDFHLEVFRSAAATSAILKTNDGSLAESPLWKWLVDRLSAVLVFDEKSTAAADDVTKLCTNFRNMPFFRALGAMLNTGTFNPFDPHTSFNVEALLNSRPEALSQGKEGRVHERSGHQMLTQHLQDLAEVRLKIESQDLSGAERLLIRGSDNGLPRLSRITAKIARSRILIASGGLGQAMELMSHLVVDERVDASYLPLEDALGGLGWPSLKPFSSNMCLLICLDLYAKQKDLERLETFKRYAFDEYTLAHGAIRPSKLNADLLQITKKRFTYFLKNICVPRVMELSQMFPSSRALDEERRDVCQSLSQMDGENLPAYQNEIITITSRLNIAAGIRLVDSSRLHVDTDLIRRSCIKEVQTDFARYKALVAAGIGVANSFDAVLRLLIKAPTAEEALLNVPENEADDLLVQIVRDLRDKFLLDPEHGLDSFLSKRVRHNSFTGQLRGSVDEAHLVTLFDSKKKRYLENDYWSAKLAKLETSKREKIKRTLREFSERFDTLSKGLPTNVLRVKTGEYPNGIFDIPLDNRILHLVRSVAQTDKSVDDFLDTCFLVFWARLGPSLEQARNILQGQMKESMSECFQRLRAGVAQVADADADKVAELSTEIGKASAGAIRQIDVITNWFIRRELAEAKQIYTLEEALDIGTEATMAAHRAVAPLIERYLQQDIRITAGGLFVIADVLWITLGNACTYSKLDKGLHVKIFISLSESRTVLRVRIENNVARGVKTHSEEKKLEEIRREIEAKQHMERLRGEGKSGLKKLAAMAFSVPNGNLTFGYESDQRFAVELDLAYIDCGETPSATMVEEQNDESIVS